MDIFNSKMIRFVDLATTHAELVKVQEHMHVHHVQSTQRVLEMIIHFLHTCVLAKKVANY